MRILARTLSLVLLVPALAFFALVATAPGTLSGFAYAVAVVLFALAFFPSEERARQRLRRGAVLLLVVTVSGRLAVAEQGHDLRMSTVDGGSTRFLDRVIDEEDLSVNAARALAWTGFVKDPDVPVLADAMRGAYGRMRAAEGATPSPVAATYAGFEAPGASDTIVIGDVVKSRGVIVFLHGFAGSFTLPCWVLAQGAAAAGFATVCPATRWVGDWWSTDGERTVRATIEGLHQRGVTHVVLAGLSNGGVGASLLAPRLAGSIEGLVVLSGASPDEAAGSPGVPVLAIQGVHDAQISAAVVHAYADRVGARYASLDAGHFAMLGREREAMGALTEFLRHRGAHGITPGRTAAASSHPPSHEAPL